MTNDVIDHVRQLAPATEVSEMDRARQRRKLNETIASLSGAPVPEEAPSYLRKRRLIGDRVSRKRLYLAGAVATIVAAAGTAIPLSLGTSAPAASGPSKGGAPAIKGTAPVMQLASYRLRLPTRYHLTAAVTSNCHPYVLFVSPTGGAPTTPSYGSQVASAAGAAGGCVFMALLPPYTPTATNPDPEKMAFPGSEEVQVGQYQAWAATTDAAQSAHDPGTGAAIVETMLYVEIPVANGQTQDLVVGDYGLSQAALVSLVANGLTTVVPTPTPGSPVGPAPTGTPTTTLPGNPASAGIYSGASTSPPARAAVGNNGVAGTSMGAGNSGPAGNSAAGNSRVSTS